VLAFVLRVFDPLSINLYIMGGRNLVAHECSFVPKQFVGKTIFPH
jgi:hypothetical protein